MSLAVIIMFVLMGLVLIGLELILPGGVLGIMGSVALVVGIVGIFVEYGPLAGLAGGFLAIVLLWLGASSWFKYFPRTASGKRFLALTDTSNWTSYDQELTALVGKSGRCHTQLRPCGTVIINGKRYDVVTRGELIAAKSAVRVVEVAGNRIVVEEINESAAPPA
ncbi:MAG: NfeD family protein [Lentisphaeria bacterium]|nr:NfeD family protein [Lentisphaeria bacterium]